MKAHTTIVMVAWLALVACLSEGPADGEVAVEPGQPSLFCPAAVDFGEVAKDQSGDFELVVRNDGDAELALQRVTLEGPSFALLVDGQAVDGGERSGHEIGLEPPVLLAPAQEHRLELRFTPRIPGTTDGELRLFSNDPDPIRQQHGAVVTLEGRRAPWRCLEVHPTEIDFGGGLVGHSTFREVELRSCGDAPVGLRELFVSPSQPFSLDLGDLLGAPPDPGVGQPWQLTEADSPVLLYPGHSTTLLVRFAPTELSPTNQDGQPIPEAASLHVRSDAVQPEHVVALRGFGAEACLPTAFIKVMEGDEVTPGTKLHLVGSQSWACDGSIAKYEWTVEQPPGSASVFLPSAAAPDPTFEANVAGTYVFRLTVWDESMSESLTAEYVVVVLPCCNGFHIELTWNTPNDPDESDEGPGAGSDLDLHLLHPYAAYWFDVPFDCHYFNPTPNWASLDPAADDDPGLDRDDSDGAGPENVNLENPEDGLTYSIGVHYWDDHDFGPAYATVRVYVASLLVFQLENVELAQGELWEVAAIDWPSGQITPVVGPDGGLVVHSLDPPPTPKP